MQATWKSARASSDLGPVLAALQRMAGNAQRCMYCLDSHGTDIEHFWPKRPYPEKMFAWPNLLLGCAECGRLKGDRFPLEGGAPLLVDPTVEDPWEHLEFDADTGNVTARFDARGTPSKKGEATVALLQLDRREALANVYLRTFRRLCQVIEDSIAQGLPNPVTLVERLRALDDHGLLGWCFSPRGPSHPTLAKLRDRHAVAWRACAAEFGAA